MEHGQGQDKNESRNLSLLNACAAGRVNGVRYSLREGADVNCRDLSLYGYTPIMIAVSKCRYDISTKRSKAIVTILVNNGADVNIADKWGNTPLMEALQNSDISVVEFLLKSGANANLRNPLGVSPLSMTMMMEYLDFDERSDRMKLLLEYGAEINLVDRWGNTPLMEAFEMGDILFVQFLLDRGANANVVSEKGVPLIHLVVQRHNHFMSKLFILNMVSLLVKYGGDVNVPDPDGFTPLMVACRNNDFELADWLLLWARADVNLLSPSGESALHMAIRAVENFDFSNEDFDNRDVVCALIYKNADLNCQDPQGNTPLMLAITRLLELDIATVKDMLDMTLSCKSVSLLNSILQSDYFEHYPWLLEKLVELGVDVNMADEMGLTPAEVAVDHHDWAAVDILLTAGANVHALDTHGHSLLHRAAEMLDGSEFEIIENLVIHGADIEMVSSSGFTGLVVEQIKAQDIKVEDIMKEVRAKADTLGLIPQRNTGLNKAIKYMTYNSSRLKSKVRTELAKFLLCRAAVSTDEKQIHYAIESGSTSLVSLFLKAGAMPELFSCSTNNVLKYLDLLQDEREVPIQEEMYSQFTPLFTAFWTLNHELAQMLIDLHFLHGLDLAPPPHLQELMHSAVEECQECLKVFNNFMSQPRSLWTICFVKISMCVGFEPERRQRLSNSVLPSPLQDKLMFGVTQ